MKYLSCHSAEKHPTEYSNPVEPVIVLNQRFSIKFFRKYLAAKFQMLNFLFNECSHFHPRYIENNVFKYSSNNIDHFKHYKYPHVQTTRFFQFQRVDTKKLERAEQLLQKKLEKREGGSSTATSAVYYKVSGRD